MPGDLPARIRAGESAAIAKAITLIERDDPVGRALCAELADAGGAAFSIGVTGPPGAGKSTLIGALVGCARADGLKVGVLSVDPSSPFTRGALLGDRVRLAEHYGDAGVFIRSMGSRGHAGGLSEATQQALTILDASGCDVVFVETVGAGQNEIGVRSVVDCVLLVALPDAGDAIQALKAGVMEIPDILAVNRRDDPRAGATAAELRGALSVDGGAKPVVLTEAVTGEGVGELWAALERERAASLRDPDRETKRSRRLESEVVALASARLHRHLEWAVANDPTLAEVIDRVGNRDLDPFTAADLIVSIVLGGGDTDSTDAR